MPDPEQNCSGSGTDGRKTHRTEEFGGKDNRKENRQGCLSGQIKQISKLFQKF